MGKEQRQAEKLRIKAEALEFFLHAARSTYPNEFIGLLEMKKGVATAIIVTVRSNYGEGFSSFDETMLPANSGAEGSVHSHPGGNASPSRQDKLFFNKMGGVHLISAYPYIIESTKAYNADGKNIPIEVI